MKVVLAPDKFAGTLSAAEAARAMADGWRAARSFDKLALVPMADGGEGTIDVVEAAVPGARREVVEVVDARGRPTRGAWLALPDGRALVEAAQACGLSRLSRQDRNPLLTTSYGVGQLLAAAAAGHHEIVIGLGGSATVDGGAGMAIALGHRLRRADGNGVKVGGRFLVDLDHVELGPPLGARVIVASDVEAPLLGSAGAVATFAPQKGAAPADLPLLERALRTLADVVERDLGGGPWRDLPGAGAAGGLGFGIAAFCDANIEPGAPVVASLVGLEAMLEGADVLVTGEGALDRQTATGKVPAYVAALARSRGLAVLAVAGRVEDGVEAAFDRVAALGPGGLERAAELVTARTAELARAL
ncbi:MAG: glycerate kinase [Egibacteraceae bacterium]